MLKELKVIAGFGHAGHTYFFEEGVTNITGPNGVGKSLLLDYLRYALFGVKALRGAAADYADLHVVLKFQVGNSTYTLERNNRKASLVDQAGNKTDGVKAVTVRVAELIGYGLEVFDIANCAMQGELEKFARMTGAERRKMIDNVMGLDILDDIVTLVQENARKEKNRLDVLTEKCVEPVEPKKPDDYTPSADLKQTLDYMLNELMLKSSLEGQLKNMPAPVEKPASTSPRSSADLLGLLNQRRVLSSELDGVRKSLASIPRTDLPAEEVQKGLEAWEAYDAVKNLPKRPPLSLAQIESQIEKWLSYQLIAEAKKKLEAAADACCPRCAHHFKLGIDADTANLAQLDLPDVGDYTLPQLHNFKHTWDLWKSVDKTAAKPDVAKETYLLAKVALDHAEERQTLIERVQSLEARLPPDVSAEYQKALANEAAWERYHEVQKMRAQIPDIEAQLAAVEFDADVYDYLQNQFKKAAAYEREVEIYGAMLKSYHKDLQELEVLKTTVVKWEKTILALREIKAELKQSTIPSLEATASRLVCEMSVGLYDRVTIDDNFEISVNDRAVHLMSGSEKSIVNLALRLALGQTLTHKHIPLFIADELDAYMNEQRSNEVVEAVLELKSRIKQMIFVTHKELPADFEIVLTGAAV